ncbi:MAG TPA: DNA translocase FtsK 4TM domain-containing protein, partial [Rhizomicrobium sp.]|nr:DNA translocase FtsK 4TM domain-containing protein [Rhizomicrobium sp.]
MSRVKTMGAYQPRTWRAEMADSIEELRRALVEFLVTIVYRGAGAAVFLGSAAILVALASYHAVDASLNNATGRAPGNLLGGFGATAADLLLQSLGVAALAAIAAPAVWGVLALTGTGLRRAGWCAIAWPASTLFAAAGLGALPLPLSLPAGAGGLVGLAALGLARHLDQVWQQSWIAYALPVAFLTTGVPLAFVATGLRFQPVWRGFVSGIAFVAYAGMFVVRTARGWWRGVPDRTAQQRDDSLDIVPEPAAASTFEPERLRETRVKRDDARKAPPKPKAARQAALDLGEGEYQLPPLGLLAEPVRVQDRAGLSDEALEENARMLEAVLGD